jgi:hypothetical protein
MAIKKRFSTEKIFSYFFRAGLLIKTDTFPDFLSVDGVLNPFWKNW